MELMSAARPLFHRKRKSAGDLAMSKTCKNRLCAIAESQPLSNHLVGAREKRFGDGKTERLSCFEIYDQLKLGRQLNWQIGRFGTLQNQIDICRRASEQVRGIVAKRYQASAFREVAIAIDRRQPV